MSCRGIANITFLGIRTLCCIARIHVTCLLRAALTSYALLLTCEVAHPAERLNDGTMTDAGSRPLPGLPPGSPVPISRSPTMSPSMFQQTPRDTISRSFCPVVAVAASPDANDAAKANNLGTFIDLIQPFGDLIEGRGNVYCLVFCYSFTTRFSDLEVGLE